MEEGAVLVLGTALMWYVFLSDGTDVPPDISDCIKNAYSRICILPEDINPVRKVPLIISGHKGEVFFDEIPIKYDMEEQEEQQQPQQHPPQDEPPPPEQQQEQQQQQQ